LKHEVERRRDQTVAAAATLLAGFAHPDARQRILTQRQLADLGTVGAEAAYLGMTHSDRTIRRWSARFFDHQEPTERSLKALIDLTRDPDAEVRVAAVHVLICEGCKPDPPTH
jgi:hypothetical protein